MVEIADGLSDIVAEEVYRISGGPRTSIQIAQPAYRLAYKERGTWDTSPSVDRTGIVESLDFCNDGSLWIYVAGNSFPLISSVNGWIQDVESLIQDTESPNRFKPGQRCDITVRKGKSTEAVNGVLVLVQASSNPDVVYFVDADISILFRATIQGAEQPQVARLSQPSPYSEPMSPRRTGTTGSYGGPSP